MFKGGDSVAVYVRISPDQVKVKIDDAWKSTLEILSEEILNDCNEYCKEDSGTLKASAMIHSDLPNGRLIWQTPYARRLRAMANAIRLRQRAIV